MKKLFLIVSSSLLLVVACASGDMDFEEGSQNLNLDTPDATSYNDASMVVDAGGEGGDVSDSGNCDDRCDYRYVTCKSKCVEEDADSARHACSYGCGMSFNVCKMSCRK